MRGISTRFIAAGLPTMMLDMGRNLGALNLILVQGNGVMSRESAKTNALEIQTISRATVHYPKSTKVKLASPPPPPPPPPADVFPKLSSEAKVLQDDFNYFIGGVSLTGFVKHLLKKYFRSDSKHQGQIAVFVEPLDELYRFQKSYGCIVAQSLRIEGPSARHLALEQEGQLIGRAVEWVEDIWHCAIDGLGNLRLAYNRKLMAWQRRV
ncbi:uncharacterized protein ARMOST_17398 [Armillaria ostoyae]|uniref:Uncharacterized protein n=1 Tax=Armillaria ostoyae TaxID=47428 RepID=A0A284RYX9_ARMOS|nr:uncharacterized protein ARMOST_17398 [Armillaria ostoyae]